MPNNAEHFNFMEAAPGLTGTQLDEIELGLTAEREEETINAEQFGQAQQIADGEASA
jgi:hypothetical protein